MAARRPAEATQPASEIEQRLTAIEAENTAIARAICRLAVKMPGANAELDRILQHEIGLAGGDIQAIIAAAKRPNGS
jgi:hypothetical protein